MTGKISPQTIRSTGSEMRIRFTSDFKGSNKGFRISVKYVLAGKYMESFLKRNTQKRKNYIMSDLHLQITFAQTIIFFARMRNVLTHLTSVMVRTSAETAAMRVQYAQVVTSSFIYNNIA